MPTSLSVATSAIKDSQLIRALQQLAEQIPETRNMVFQWRILEGNDFNSCPFAEIQTNLGLVEIVNQQAEILRWAQLQFQVAGHTDNSNLVFTRDATGGLTINVNLPDAFNQNQIVKNQVAIAFHRVFGKYARSNVVDQLHPLLSDFYQRRDETLVRLEELQAKAFSESEATRRRSEETLDVDRARLDKTYRQREQQLDAEHAARTADIARREEELAAAKKALDDRDNTQTRRAIQKDLKRILEERNAAFSLSRGTEARMLPIKIAFALEILGLAVLVAWAFYKTTLPLPDGEPYWFGMLRLGLLLAALAGSVVFYVRWQNRWTEIHAGEEVRLKRLEFDVDRASWLVEFLMEWRGQGGGDLPRDVVASLAGALLEPTQDRLSGDLASPALMEARAALAEAKATREHAQSTNA